MFYFRSSFTFFFLVLGLHLSGYTQHLTISSSGQTGTSGTNWSTSGTNPVTISVSGTATVNVSVITSYLNAGTSVILNNGVSNGDINIDNTITATGSGSLTLTANRSIILSANISTSGTQTYNGAVTIKNSDRTLTSSAGDIVINGGIDGDVYTVSLDNNTSRSLSLSAAAGAISLLGNIGQNTALYNFTVNSLNGTSFAGTIINLGQKYVTYTAYTSNSWVSAPGWGQAPSLSITAPVTGTYYFTTVCYSNNNCGSSINAVSNWTGGNPVSNDNQWRAWPNNYSSSSYNYTQGQTITFSTGSFSNSYYVGLRIEVTYSYQATRYDQGQIQTTGPLIFGTNSNITISEIIAGTGSVVKAGSGSLTLSSSNTYTGGTRIDAGYVIVTSSDNLGGGTTNLTFNGGGLKATNTTDFSSRFSTAAGQQYKLDANGQNITWATALTSSGGSLTKLGTGILTLSAANTYTGTTTISAGTIQLGVNNALPNTSLTIDAGATLALAGFNQSVGAINGSGTISTTSGTPTLTCTVNVDPQQDFSGVISGPITLIKAGTATLTLSSGSSYTGSTSITGGKLLIGNTGRIGAGTTTRTYASNISISAGATFEFGSNTDHLFSGVISGAGSVVQSGSGTLTLSGNNTYTGGTRIDAGYVIVTSSGNLGGGTTNLIFNGGGLKATNTTDFSSRFSTAAGQQYKLDANGQNITWATALTSSGGSLTKLGTGILMLSAANTYTGTTTVSGGTLQFNHTGGTSIPNTNNVIISGGTLKVSSSQIVNDLTLSSGTLEVDNNIVLANNGVFVGGDTIANNGTMVIIGSSTFPGSSSTISTMNNLTIDRSAGVILNKNLSVTGTLTLLSGVLEAGASSLTVTGTISGTSSSSYVKTSSTGVLKMPLSNGSSRTFPVGNSSYNPVTLTNNSGSSDDFSVRVSDAVLDGGTSGNIITDKVVKRTWHIEKTNANAGLGVDMTFSWDNSEEGTNVTDFKLSHFASSWALAAGTSTNVTTSGTTKTMTHTGYTGTFSPFAIGSSNSSLPVTWLSFTAEKQGAGALLKWSTASEQNTKDFEVQHSANTLSWTPLGTVAAAGNSTSVRQYSFTHSTPFKGGLYNYYRILQRDLDGTFSYSKIASLIYDEPGADVIVYPNPANEFVTIYLAESKEVKLINVTGATVWRGTLAAGRNNIPLTHLAKGVYWVVTENYKKQLLIL